MSSRSVVAVAAVFVTGTIANTIIYYGLLPGVLQEGDAVRAVINPLPKLVGELIFAIIFVFLFQRLLRGQADLAQGLRYGAAVGLLYYVAGTLHILAIVPLSTGLAIGSAVLGFGKVLALGAITALVLARGAPQH